MSYGKAEKKARFLKNQNKVFSETGYLYYILKVLYGRFYSAWHVRLSLLKDYLFLPF